MHGRSCPSPTPRDMSLDSESLQERAVDGSVGMHLLGLDKESDQASQLSDDTQMMDSDGMPPSRAPPQRSHSMIAERATAAETAAVRCSDHGRSARTASTQNISVVWRCLRHRNERGLQGRAHRIACEARHHRRRQRRNRAARSGAAAFARGVYVHWHWPDLRGVSAQERCELRVRGDRAQSRWRRGECAGHGGSAHQRGASPVTSRAETKWNRASLILQPRAIACGDYLVRLIAFMQARHGTAL